MDWYRIRDYIEDHKRNLALGASAGVFFLVALVLLLRGGGETVASVDAATQQATNEVVNRLQAADAARPKSMPVKEDIDLQGRSPKQGVPEK